MGHPGDRPHREDRARPPRAGAGVRGAAVLRGRAGSAGVGRREVLHRVHEEAPTSFVWTGDSCGQGWGINPDLGGLLGYRAMHDTRPDFFLHSGDTIYADGAIAEAVTEPDGQMWHNVVDRGGAKVAETLTSSGAGTATPCWTTNVRAMAAEVPTIAQWDDHETTNNWYPGEVLDDPRYTLERRVDVLAARARPGVAGEHADRRPTGSPARHGFAPARIYRKIARGPHLDVFSLDMRTFKDPNTAGQERPSPDPHPGRGADRWLIREVARSRATWKVIAADMPLGLIVPDGPVDRGGCRQRRPGPPLGRELEIARVLSAIKRNGVRNVVWITADVHYCAAHHYDPVARRRSPTSTRSGSSSPDRSRPARSARTSSTARSARQVVFSKAATRANESPRAGQPVLRARRDRDDGVLTVSLRDLTGAMLFTQELEPQPQH